LAKVIVTYDIEKDKKRNKIFELLKDYGRHVQFSVFELEIEIKDLNFLTNKIKSTIDRKKDSVKIYFLSEQKKNYCKELGTDKTEKEEELIFM